MDETIDETAGGRSSTASALHVGVVRAAALFYPWAPADNVSPARLHEPLVIQAWMYVNERSARCEHVDSGTPSAPSLSGLDTRAGEEVADVR